MNIDDKETRNAVFLDVEQTRTILRKGGELFNADNADVPCKINAGIFLGFGINRIMRGGAEWVSYTIHHIEYKDTKPPRYLVKLPPTKTNKIQHAKINRKPFEVISGSPLFAQLHMYFQRRGSHIEKDGLFLHPLAAWRVYLSMLYIHLYLYFYKFL